MGAVVSLVSVYKAASEVSTGTPGPEVHGYQRGGNIGGELDLVALGEKLDDEEVPTYSRVVL